jgi:hypothetical protein
MPSAAHTADTAAKACGSTDAAGGHACGGEAALPVGAVASLLVATASLFTWTP